MPSQIEVQKVLCGRAEELARGEGWQGPARFGPRHYKMALAEVSPEQRAVERGMAPKPEATQAQLAARHQDELARQLLRQGKAKSYAAAVKLADKTAPAIAAKAGAATYDLGFDNLGQPVRRSPALSDSEQKLVNVTADQLVQLLVTIPGQGELAPWRDLVRQWAALVAPRMPAGTAPGGPGVDLVNQINEEIWQQVRRRRLAERGIGD